jgi:hypothetical protein
MDSYTLLARRPKTTEKDSRMPGKTRKLDEAQKYVSSQSGQKYSWDLGEILAILDSEKSNCEQMPLM